LQHKRAAIGWPIIAISVVALMLIAVAAIVVLSMQTATPSGGTSSLTSSTPCEITGEGCLLMKVLDSSNNEPAGSLPVQVEALYPACSTNPAHTESLGTQETNASGFLSLSGPYNWYYLSVGYGFQSYPVNASINAGTLTCVTLNVPSGNLNMTQHCNQTGYFSQQATTITTAYCVQTGPVQIVYVKFVNDSSDAPISGVTIGGSFQPNCQGDLLFPIQNATSPPNGTLLITIGLNALGGCECTYGTLNLTIQYSGHPYNLTLSSGTEYLAQTVVYTIGLPSGHLLGTQITDDGATPSGSCTTIGTDNNETTTQCYY
jgi:hypothetical protein